MSESTWSCGVESVVAELILASITCVCTSRSSNMSSNFSIVDDIWGKGTELAKRVRRPVAYLFQVHGLYHFLQSFHDASHCLGQLSDGNKTEYGTYIQDGPHTSFVIMAVCILLDTASTFAAILR